MEPFYIRQTAEPMTNLQQRAWFQACATEAKSEGAKLCRFSIHQERPEVLLVEGWRGTAREVGDQGDPRFTFTASPTDRTEEGGG